VSDIVRREPGGSQEGARRGSVGIQEGASMELGGSQRESESVRVQESENESRRARKRKERGKEKRGKKKGREERKEKRGQHTYR
jgi:hypothetical protein